MRRIVLAVVLATMALAALAATTPAAEAGTTFYAVGQDGTVAITMRDGTALRPTGEEHARSGTASP